MYNTEDITEHALYWMLWALPTSVGLKSDWTEQLTALLTDEMKSEAEASDGYLEAADHYFDTDDYDAETRGKVEEVVTAVVDALEEAEGKAEDAGRELEVLTEEGVGHAIGAGYTHTGDMSNFAERYPELGEVGAKLDEIVQTHSTDGSNIVYIEGGRLRLSYEG